MNRGKTDVKKTLVRNPEQPIPTSVKVLPAKASLSNKVDVDSYSKYSANHPASKCKTVQKTRFNVPQMYSTLKLSKKIDELVQSRRTKSLPEIEKLAVDEKVSRKVNFPYGQQVFKDLIPLADNEIKVTPIVVTRGPVYQKDQVPILSDFLRPRKQKVYYQHVQNSSKYFEEYKIDIPSSSSLRLYKVLQVNE